MFKVGIVRVKQRRLDLIVSNAILYALAFFSFLLISYALPFYIKQTMTINIHTYTHLLTSSCPYFSHVLSVNTFLYKVTIH